MSAPTARERLDSLLSGAIARYAPIAAPETPPAACSVDAIETTEQPETERPTCSPEQVQPPVRRRSPRPRRPVQKPVGAVSESRCDPSDPNAWRDAYESATREYVPPWKLERRERRMHAAVLERLDSQRYKYAWQTADHDHYSPAELAAIDAHRQRLLATAAHADGSKLSRLEGVHSPADQRVSRLIRDDALFAETEWGKLHRADPLYANAVLEASLGLRDDGTCARDWHSQRARSTLQFAWLKWRAGTTRLGDVGTLTVRGVSIDYLRTIGAPPGKARLHRNTLTGTHRAGSTRNEEVGYIVALQLAGALERFQYGDRSAAVRQVNEYTLRVSTQNEKQEALIERHEAAYRELLRNRWSRLAAMDALRVITGQQRALELQRVPDTREAELRAAIRAELDECTGPP